MFIKNLKRSFSIFMLFIIFTTHSFHVFAEPADDFPDNTANSAILVDVSRGQILYGKASSKKIHVSIACKIMTAILAIEKSEPDSKVTISKDAVNEKGSLLNLEVGEKYDIEDLLYAVVLTSANDAASALAESVGGDVPKFVELMNAKAKELKMTNTVFKNPTGLYHEQQYTTAYDLSVLIRYAVSNSTFARFFSTKAIPWNSSGNSKILVNSNQLFWSYEGTDGGKTGFNEENRLSVVTTATRNDMQLISVVLDSIAEKAFEDSVKVLDFGFMKHRKGLLVQKDQVLDGINIGENRLSVISREDVYYIHPTGENYIKSMNITYAKDLKPPITKDKILGTAEYVLKDNTRILVNLFTDTELQPPEDIVSILYKKLKDIREIFIFVVILSVIEVILITYNIIKFIMKKVRNRR